MRVRNEASFRNFPSTGLRARNAATCITLPPERGARHAYRSKRKAPIAVLPRSSVNVLFCDDDRATGNLCDCTAQPSTNTARAAAPGRAAHRCDSELTAS